jgi:hypothetical protein
MDTIHNYKRLQGQVEKSFSRAKNAEDKKVKYYKLHPLKPQPPKPLKPLVLMTLPLQEQHSLKSL